MSFTAPGGGGQATTLPVLQREYLELLQWTAREFPRGLKDAAMDHSEAAEEALRKLDINPRAWLDSVRSFNRYFYLAAGEPEALQAYQAQNMHHNVFKFPDKWIRGIKPAARLYGT